MINLFFRCFMRLVLLIILTIHIVYASNLESLLKEYESSSKNSLKTLDEKMGYVIIYTQEKLQHMQYQTLSDVLREIPINNLNTNRMGINTLSFSGSKTEANGFFRLFINDHEVSSIYIQSPALGWIDMPISMIDHIEIYYGEASLTLGNETGLQFIRVYTKNAKKENGTEVTLNLSNKSSNSEEITHSSILSNGWSYLLHASNQNFFDEEHYNNIQLNNDTNQQYLFLNLKNEHNNIDMGYTGIEKTKYMGYSTDLTPNDGELLAEDLFINMSTFWNDDKSLKSSISFDRNTIEYSEYNDEGLFVVPIINLANVPTTMPKQFFQDLQFTKLNAYLSKELQVNNHSLFGAINFQNKSYDVQSRYSTNFLNTTTDQGHFNDFKKENLYSILFQDDYKLYDNLHLISNIKVDRFDRSSSLLKDDTEYLYKIGTIYLPTENLGFKTYYTKSYMTPSFYNIDFKAQSQNSLKTQYYNYFIFDSVYTFGNSRLNMHYYNVQIDNFIYYSPVGFINVADTVKIDGCIFNYEYTLPNKDTLEFNYYFTNLNQSTNNTTDGGFIKYMGEYEKFDYFTSLIYKEGYSYLDLTVPNSYNLNLGFTYNYTKNLSFSLKGTNLLNKPTRSLAIDKSNFFNQKNNAFEDYDRAATFKVRWLF